MQTTDHAARRRRRSPWTSGLAALSLLALPLLLAAPAEAQRGGHGGGRGGYSGGHHGSGHQGHYGSHRGHRGGGYGRHDHGYRGHRGGYGKRYGYGYGGHFGYGYGGHFGYGYGPRYGHGGSYAYFGYRPGYWGGYAYYRPRVYHPPYVGYGYPAYHVSAPRTSVYLDYDLTRDPSQRFPVAELDPRVAAARSEAGGSGGEAAVALDAREEPARVTLRAEPGDASVYLDGRFLGLAAELPEALLIEPGDHLLEIVRPGFAGQEVELAVEPGEEIEVETRLEPAG